MEDSLYCQAASGTIVAIHRPCGWGGVGTAVTFLPLTHVRDRSAERRLDSPWPLAAPRAVVPARPPPGAPPRRFFTRSPCFFRRTRRLRRPVIQAALALPFIRRCPATKGGPLSGSGR